MRRRRPLIALVLVLGLAHPLGAQEAPRGLVPIQPARSWAGIALLFALPQDEFRTYVKNGWGLGLDVEVPVAHSPVFQLRFEGAIVQYGNERKRACLSYTIGCRITVDVNTSNNIILFGVGPQVVVPRGAVRPYLNATAGASYFFTRSSVEGTSDLQPFAESTNFDDFIFSWTGGGGVYIDVRRGRKPIAIDLDARYHGNGRTSYLREGSISDNPDGSITITPIRSRT